MPNNPEGYIDTDPFDPELTAHAEKLEASAVEDESDKQRQFLARRREAYRRVFTPGNTEQADIDIVLNDLARFCRAYTPSYDMRDGEHASKLQDFKEGRREVFYRIIDHTQLGFDTLYVKYMAASTNT